MAHKHTQKEIDEVINKWRGKHSVERMIAEYDGSKTESLRGRSPCKEASPPANRELTSAQCEE